MLMLMLHFVDAAAAVPYSIPLTQSPLHSLMHSHSNMQCATKLQFPLRLMKNASADSRTLYESDRERVKRENERDRSIRSERDALSHHMQHELLANHVIN